MIAGIGGNISSAPESWDAPTSRDVIIGFYFLFQIIITIN